MHQSYGFVQYKYASTVSYAIQLFQGTALFGQELKLKYYSKYSNHQFIYANFLLTLINK